MKTEPKITSTKLLPIQLPKCSISRNNQASRPLKQHYRLKSQGTIDTAISRKQILKQPQAQINQILNKNKLRPRRQLRPIKLIRPYTQLQTYCLNTQKYNQGKKQQEYLGFTKMNDDFKFRTCVYKEIFAMSRHKIMQLQIGFTQKFCYITLQNTKRDLSYKLRLLLETGKTILDRFKHYKLKFKDYIYRDETKKYFLNAPFPPFQRKFKFIPIQHSTTIEEQLSDQDIFLRNRIKGLDRTQQIFQHFKDSKEVYRKQKRIKQKEQE